MIYHKPCPIRLVYLVCVFSRMKLPFDLTNQVFLFYISMLLRLSASSHWMIFLQARSINETCKVVSPCVSLDDLTPELANETCKYISPRVSLDDFLEALDLTNENL
jgi:hypothetical protein